MDGWLDTIYLPTLSCTYVLSYTSHSRNDLQRTVKRTIAILTWLRAQMWDPLLAHIQFEKKKTFDIPKGGLYQWKSV